MKKILNKTKRFFNKIIPSPIRKLFKAILRNIKVGIIKIGKITKKEIILPIKQYVKEYFEKHKKYPWHYLYLFLFIIVFIILKLFKPLILIFKKIVYFIKKGFSKFCKFNDNIKTISQVKKGYDKFGKITEKEIISPIKQYVKQYFDKHKKYPWHYLYLFLWMMLFIILKPFKVVKDEIISSIKQYIRQYFEKHKKYPWHYLYLFFWITIFTILKILKLITLSFKRIVTALKNGMVKLGNVIKGEIIFPIKQYVIKYFKKHKKYVWHYLYLFLWTIGFIIYKILALVYLFVWIIGFTIYKLLVVTFKACQRFYRRHREATWGYLFISIWLIGFIVFTIVPLAQSFHYSLNKATMGATIKLDFIKFENYHKAFFVETEFIPLYLSYLSQIVIVVPITIVFALIISMLLNQKIKMRGMWRVLFFLPVIISTGPIIQTLTNQGASTVPILNDVRIQSFIVHNLPPIVYQPILALFNQIIMILWYTGIPILIFLAGLQKIDRSIYEAAAIDGASPWEIFWKVTLPAVKQFITVNVIYVIVTLSYYSGFAGNDIITYIREESFGANTHGFGYGSAIAWIFFITIVILILIFVGILNFKRNREV